MPSPRSARVLFLSCLFTISLTAQEWLSIGVKGGLPLTDPFKNINSLVILGPEIDIYRAYSGPSSFLIGPTIELKLPFGLSAEADALYGRTTLYESNTSGPSQPPTSGVFITNGYASSLNLSAWQFPLLAKYRLPVPFIKPYLEIGPSFRLVSRSPLVSSKGISAGVGLEFSVKHFLFSPELRYTHWGADPGPVSSFRPASETNQLAVLAGISTRSFFSARTASPVSLRWLNRWSLGVKAGMPFTDAFVHDQTCALLCPDTTPRNYLIGPMIGLEIRRNFSLEADALYSPLSLTTLGNPSPTGFVVSPSPTIQTFNAWQFSIVGIYKLPPSFARPYFEAGPHRSRRHLTLRRRLIPRRNHRRLRRRIQSSLAPHRARSPFRPLGSRRPIRRLHLRLPSKPSPIPARPLLLKALYFVRRRAPQR